GRGDEYGSFVAVRLCLRHKQPFACLRKIRPPAKVNAHSLRLALSSLPRTFSSSNTSLTRRQGTRRAALTRNAIHPTCYIVGDVMKRCGQEFQIILSHFRIDRL